MPRKPRRGRRSIESTTASSRSNALTFGGKKRRIAKSVPDGEYDVVVDGARLLVGRSGNTTVQLTLKDNATNEYIRVRPLLVATNGSTSDLTERNLERLEAIANLSEDEEISPDEMMKRLTGARVLVELVENKDSRGEMVNDITDVFDPRESEKE